MHTTYKTFTTYVIIAAALFLTAFFAFASSPFDITFPIPELGNCGDQAACKTYCDDIGHKNECLAFAEKHGLASKEKIERAQQLPLTGPGDCSTQSSCKAYCDDATHFEECFAWAKEHGLVTDQDAQRAEKLREITGPGGCKGEACKTYCDDPKHGEECLKFGEENGFITKEEAAHARKFVGKPGPGGCRGEECRTYCQDVSHAEACLKFSEENGFITKEEAQRARKFIALGQQGGPGGCKEEKACREYCADPAHAEECISFAEKNGMMSKEDAARAKKLAGKPGPGGCVGEQCRDYCEDPSHGEECLKFAEENGLIPKEEAARARKYMKAAEEGGPGGCKREECRTYCENPEHQKECFEFGKSHGLLSPEDEKRFEAGERIDKKLKESGGPGGCKTDNECRAYCMNADHVEECIAFAAAHGGVDRAQAERMLKDFTDMHEGSRAGYDHPPTPEEMERMKMERLERFDAYQENEEKFRGEMMMPQDFAGPGGCKGPDECIKYCFEHREECMNFRPTEHMGPGLPAQPGTGPMPGAEGMTGPGGCQGPEECTKYCSDPAHREECAKFNPSAGMQPPGEIFRQVPPGTPSQFNPPPLPPISFPGICNSLEECKRYCSDPAYMTLDACMKLRSLMQQYMGTAPTGGTMPAPSYAPQGTPPPAPTGASGPTEQCPTEYMPVCGMDGKTYPNKCFAYQAKVGIRSTGTCDGTMPPPYPSQTQTPYNYQQPPPEGMMTPPPDGMMPPPDGTMPPPPQPTSRSGALELLGNLWNGFLSLFR